MNPLRNFSLKYKILLPGVIGVVGFAIYLAVNFSAETINSRILSEVEDSYLPALELSDRNISLLSKLKQDLVFAATTGEASMVDDAQKLADEMNQNMVKLEKLQKEAEHIKQAEIQ